MTETKPPPQEQALIDEAFRTGWLDQWGGGGPFDIDTCCVWCGCVVNPRLKDIHRLKCSEPLDPNAPIDTKPA